MASPLDKRGTITQLPSGSWRARLPGSIGGAGRRGSFTGRTYEEAAGWLAAALEIAGLCKMAGRDPDMLGRRNGEVFSVSERAIGATYWKV